MTGGRFKQRQIYCHFFFLHFFSPIDGNFFYIFLPKKAFWTPQKYTKFCISFKRRKSRCRTTLRLQFGYSKWFSSAALHGVILDWVEQ